MIKKISTVVSLLTIMAAALWSAPAIESAFEWEQVLSGRALVEFKQLLALEPELSQTGTVSTGIKNLDRILENLGVYNIVQVAPVFQPELYIMRFDISHSVEEAVSALKGCYTVSNAWPEVLIPWVELRFNPDDMMMPSQWHQEQIDAQEAWAIFRGDEAVQVAIIDGGVTYTHPDLENNIWVNPWEDLNGNGVIEEWEWDGIDNEGNGYVDDFWGWDWIYLDSSMVWPGEDPGPPDNDPSDFDGHGTHCAGDACAVTDNGTGVASPGFNSEIMCLRAGYLSSGGQGFVITSCAINAVYYAIAMEAEVISMSFGGPGISPLMQALATANDSGLVLLAAAGNESASQLSYPAGYDFVIAVAATGPGDYLADFTNYGDWITICAPGVSIFSTIVEGYSNMDGTSMSTPVTAGVAALVKALKPEWGSVQVGQWLAETADNIDLQNPGYIGMMGGGRVNAAKAVDMFVTIDSLWTDTSVDGDRLCFDQENALYVQYHKSYGDAFGVSLEMSSDNPRVSFSQAIHYIGDIFEGEIGDNSGESFLLTVEYGGMEYEVVELNAHFTGEDFDFTQILEIPVGRGQVLIIDADQNQSQLTSAYYEESMNEMGYSWETWKRSERVELGEEMEEYEAVILFTGTAETDILPAGDWDDLQDYVNNGGNFILTGQNIAEDLSVNQPNVLTDFLRVNFLEPHSNDLTISGMPGNPLTGDMYLVMAGSGGAWNQNSLDVVETLIGAETVFVYNPNDTTRAAGIRLLNGNMFYCSFGIEGINDTPSSGNTKAEVLGMMFDQFQMTGVESPIKVTIPTSVQLYPFPNPFNSTLRIAYQLNRASPVTVGIYDILGREVAVHRVESAPAGTGQWNWEAGGTLGSGLYFVRLDAGGKAIQKKVVFLK